MAVVDHVHLSIVLKFQLKKLYFYMSDSQKKRIFAHIGIYIQRNYNG